MNVVNEMNVVNVVNKVNVMNVVKYEKGQRSPLIRMKAKARVNVVNVQRPFFTPRRTSIGQHDDITQPPRPPQ